jgi:hypothetical protein
MVINQRKKQKKNKSKKKKTKKEKALRKRIVFVPIEALT